jgi:hypothetical protein
MNKREFINHHLLQVAILGNFSEFYLGEMFLSFLGLPIIFFGKILYFFSIDLFYLGLIAAVVFSMIITFFGLRVIPVERFTKLLLPKILGFMLAFFWVKTRILNFLLIGVLYNFLHKFIFKYFVTKNVINNFASDTLGLNIFWEKYILLFAVAISAGLSTNIIYTFLKIFSLVL